MPRKQTKRRGLYVVFDKAPGHESARFVEVEDEKGKSVNLEPDHSWNQRSDGLWEIGPFDRAFPPAKKLRIEIDPTGEKGNRYE